MVSLLYIVVRVLSLHSHHASSSCSSVASAHHHQHVHNHGLTMVQGGTILTTCSSNGPNSVSLSSQHTPSAVDPRHRVGSRTHTSTGRTGIAYHTAHHILLISCCSSEDNSLCNLNTVILACSRAATVNCRHTSQ